MHSPHCGTTLVILLLTACPGRDNVPCTENADCNLSSGGICTLAATGNQWCAYPDPDCPAGLRYSDEGVGDNLSGVCVEGTRHTLTVNTGGNGAGVVSSEPAGLTCSAGTCTSNFPEGTVVQLSATATMGGFLGWADACRGQVACVVTMDSDRVMGALFGTPGAALWARQLGSTGSERGYSIAVDRDDNLIAVGHFSETVTPIAGTELRSAGGTDVYVVKLANSTGQVVWARRFGGTMYDGGLAVAVDGSNNVYVTGQFQGVVDFGNGPLQSTGPIGDVFVLMLNPNGDLGWARKISGTNSIAPRVIAATDTSVVVAGFYTSSMTVDTRIFMSAGVFDIFVVQMSAPTGVTSWAKSFGGTFSDVANGVAIDSNDNVVLTGSFGRTVDFGGGPLTTGGDTLNAFLLKLAGSNGAHLFSKQFGGPGNDRGNAIAVDPMNNILVVGDFRETASFGCVEGVTASQNNRSDIFLVKYSQAGACVWAKAFGGTGLVDRQGAAVTVNSAGDVAIAGEFGGSISFGGQTLVSAGDNPDMFAARFNGDGMHLNSVRGGGTGGERGSGIAQSTTGQFFVTGWFLGFAEFGGEAFMCAGVDDAFVVGLAPL
jgi:hypothetical protein